MIVVANDLAIYNVYNYDNMYKKTKTKLIGLNNYLGKYYKQEGYILL